MLILNRNPIVPSDHLVNYNAMSASILASLKIALQIALFLQNNKTSF